MADQEHRRGAGKTDEKPHAGAAHRGAERPDGAPQSSGGASQQPAAPQGEHQQTPDRQPGYDPNDKARHQPD